MIDIQKLISWLGVEGAKAGLDKSEMTNSELLESFANLLPKNSSKLKRSEIIEEVVLATRKMTHKSVEELMEMSK
ncbi:hypothetical protein QP671_26780, partial [Klebsiella pneumoniae]|nr:hypothetical protein [Klebsiella pneumoniae]